MARPRPVDYLQPGEGPLETQRRHPLSAVDEWLALLVTWAVVSGLLLFVTRFVPDDVAPAVYGFLAIVSVAAIAMAVLIHWRRVTALYTVTPERVYHAYGRFRFHLLQTTYDKVTDLHVHQSIFGRWWGYGTVRVQTAGAGLSFAGVRDPLAFKQQVEAARTTFLHTLVEEHRAAARPADAATERPAEADSLWHGSPARAYFVASSLFAYLLLLVTLVALGFTLVVDPSAGWVSLGLGVFAGLILWGRYIQYRYTRFEVTTEGTVLTRGWLSRRRVETTFAKVTDVSVDQDILARVMDYGRITINTAGSNEAPVVFQGVAHPEQVKAIIDEARRGGRR